LDSDHDGKVVRHGDHAAVRPWVRRAAGPGPGPSPAARTPVAAAHRHGASDRDCHPDRDRDRRRQRRVSESPGRQGRRPRHPSKWSNFNVQVCGGTGPGPAGAAADSQARAASESNSRLLPPGVRVPAASPAARRAGRLTGTRPAAVLRGSSWHSGWH
jgi:hypothetical protein